MKVLSVEEMQSDLVQGVKQYNQVLEEKKVGDLAEEVRLEMQDDIIKDFPFKNNWYELTLKRLIRYAADNGFDAISIPKAQVIQDRYSLTRRVNDLEITAYFPERQEIGIMGRDQNGVTQIDELFTFEKLKKDLGEDTQKKILEAASKSTDANDEYIKVPLDKSIEFGGEGKARLYNKTIPSFLKKYGKKWNAKVFDDNLDALPNPSMPVTMIEITPEMKQSVQETPQALFSYFGGTVLGYEMVKDNIENNIISQPTENMY
jgi:hypothetical protein